MSNSALGTRILSLHPWIILLRTYTIMTSSSWLVLITRSLLPGKLLVLPWLLQTWTSRGRSGIARFEWLSTLQVNSLKKRWKHVLAGNRICPLCHCVDDKHVPENCRLLKDLNLKLICGPPPTAALPATTPAPGALAASPSGHLAMADGFSAVDLTGQATAPSGKEWHWDWDDSGLDYTMPSACNSNNNAAIYLSCLHVAVEHILCMTASVSHTAPHPAADPLHPSLGINSCCIVLSKRLRVIIARMADASIHPCFSHHFTFADSGATDHMILDKSAFISYKTVTHLQVSM